MTRRDALSAMGALPRLSAAPVRPNVVLILADDQGVGDLTCYNRESVIPTPHTDRIAQGGTRFTDAHSGSAVCSPTRYGLLTGRYAWRTRLQHHVLRPFDPPLIEEGRLTLPGMLRRQGCRTSCVGKWHLGWTWPKKDGEYDFTARIADGPTTRGFDRYFGTDVPNYPPYCFIENDRTAGLPTDRRATTNLDGVEGPMLPGWRMDAILPTLADRAVATIREGAASGKPFFLYFPLTSPHQPIAPSPEFRGKSGINDLADFMIETDAVVGRVLDELERSKAAANTIVIYAGDNGGAPLAHRKPLAARGHKLSGPYRAAKASIYEGGHRVPLLVRWPGRVRGGGTSPHLVCLNDIMATLAEALGVALPDDAAEDSFSFLAALERRAARAPVRAAIVNHSNVGQFAIREGRWKLILPAMPQVTANFKQEVSAEELYDLDADPGETDNALVRRPEIAARLRKLLEQHKTGGRSAPARRA
ncbi:MAG: arylsulfatase [Bryobacterales bacterium]|nr:arylsulfatase [Bryobacterales bacterium]